MSPKPVVFSGDCLEVMKLLPDSSIDSIVTDPPYGLGFMGKAWDDLPPGLPWAQECLRVLKPGGHLLAFGGTRTWHRLACAVEDAGFEMRDSIAWLYGSGFPKSLDVSKAIDKVRDWSLVERLSGEIKRARAEAGLSLVQIGQAMQEATANQYGAWYHRGGHMFFETGRSLPSRPEWEHLRHVLPIATEFVAVYEEAEREVLSSKTTSRANQGWANEVGSGMFQSGDREVSVTAPATEAAQQWQGWGTALKPAFEPIVVARKPLSGTVAANVLAHSTGALNIDGCRIESDGGHKRPFQPTSNDRNVYGAQTGFQPTNAEGRWPANVVLDEDQAAALDQQSGTLTSGAWRGVVNAARGPQSKGAEAERVREDRASDSGGASRFFYVTGREGDTLDSCESVSTAGPSSSLPSPSVGSAPSGAATRERPEGPFTPPPWSAPSTPATASASRPSVGIATPQTPLTVSGSSLGWLPDAPSPSDSPASSVATPESDTTRTTPIPSSSTGTADRTTSPDTSFSTGPGGQGLPIDSLCERFRYVAKAPKSERPVVDGTAHPTVKPLALMRWLVRLVTPPGGYVLDPFAGSGTTLEAAALEGFASIGIERDESYQALIRARIERLPRDGEPEQQDETPDTEQDPTA